MTKIIKAVSILLSTLILLVAAVATLIYAITFHPKPIQAAAVTCPADTPTLTAGQSVKVFNYNVQYFAGKDYVFYYDVADEAGPDTRPSPEAISKTFDGIAALIRQENPDVLLLQEVHEGAKATDYENQTERLLSLIGDQYPCYSEAFYWQAKFVPHPSIMGSVGMKLVTLSKYKLQSAQRYQLTKMDSDPVTKAFNLKRAILTTEMPVQGGEPLIAMNTHLDAFSQGMDTMDRQVAEVATLLEATQQPWFIGGDFNLLPPDQYAVLPDHQQIWYNPETEIAPLVRQYPSIPSMANVSGSDRERWFTHYPNDPLVKGPDRTIDYIFYDSRLTLEESSVIQDEAITLSDHLPVTAVFALPEAN